MAYKCFLGYCILVILENNTYRPTDRGSDN